MQQELEEQAEVERKKEEMYDNISIKIQKLEEKIVVLKEWKQRMSVELRRVKVQKKNHPNLQYSEQNTVISGETEPHHVSIPVPSAHVLPQQAYSNSHLHAQESQNLPGNHVSIPVPSAHVLPQQAYSNSHLHAQESQNLPGNHVSIPVPSAHGLPQQAYSNSHLHAQESQNLPGNHVSIPVPSAHVLPQQAYSNSHLHAQESQNLPGNHVSHPSTGPSYSALPMRTGPQKQRINQPNMYYRGNTNLNARNNYYSVPYRPDPHSMPYGGTLAIPPPQTHSNVITHGYPIRQPFFAPPPQTHPNVINPGYPIRQPFYAPPPQTHPNAITPGYPIRQPFFAPPPQTHPNVITPGYPNRQPFYAPPSPQPVEPGSYAQFEPDQNVYRPVLPPPIRHSSLLPSVVSPWQHPERRCFYNQPQMYTEAHGPYVRNEFQI
ncbi:unnamed protein product [Nezara viridula]|uniref:Uncharacterized protein n=1 Tax=Nezara viridula TaxID=85310 RepID=A0A9P0EBI6_NEZVI|nr:unnamed protein product [Nezara viridula]